VIEAREDEHAADNREGQVTLPLSPVSITTMITTLSDLKDECLTACGFSAVGAPCCAGPEPIVVESHHIEACSQAVELGVKYFATFHPMGKPGYERMKRRYMRTAGDKVGFGLIAGAFISWLLGKVFERLWKWWKESRDATRNAAAWAVCVPSVTWFED